MSDNIRSISSLTNLISHINLKNLGHKEKDNTNTITDELSGVNNQQDLLAQEIAALMDIEQMAQLPE